MRRVLHTPLSLSLVRTHTHTHTYELKQESESENVYYEGGYIKTIKDSKSVKNGKRNEQGSN